MIIDEIHALAATKRGAHLMLSLERLEAATGTPAAAHRAVGHAAPARRDRPLPRRARPSPAASGRSRSSTPAPQAARHRGDRARRGHGRARPGRATTPARPRRPSRVVDLAVDPPRLLELIRAHRTTIVFVNARRAGRAARRAPQRARRRGARARPPRLARARAAAPGRGRAQGRPAAARIVATSSLELGIDMGAVDLVVQVESPRSVARGLQRIGRAGHQVGEPSTGKIFPKYRGDLLEAAVVVERMRDGLIEETRYPRNPLDVLAQQIVAMLRGRRVARRRPARARAPRRATSPSSPTTCSARCSTCSPGRYPSDEFAELRPRVVWDRANGVVRAREGASGSPSRAAARSPTAACSACSCPTAARVGELDEEMVYESRVRRDASCSGASAWRIEDITFDRVIVTPAPGRAGQDAVLARRPRRAGRSSSAARSARSCASSRDARRPTALDAAARRRGLDERAANNLVAVPRRAGRGHRRGPRRPHDRRRALPRRDRRLARLHPHRRSARACTRRGRSRSRSGCRRARTSPSQVLWSDDGIILRLPEAVDDDPARRCCSSTPTRSTSSSSRALPARRCSRRAFRENAARALLLPRRRPGRAHAAVAAAPARGRPARRRRAATRRSRSCSRPRASASATCSTCPRCARCSPTSARASVRVVAGRDRACVAVRAVAAVRLDRGLHVRGRRAARRAPRRRARARPRPAARPARRRGAARAARPGGARRARARAAAAVPTAPRARRRRRCTTCSRPRPARPIDEIAARVATRDPAAVDRRSCVARGRARRVSRRRRDRVRGGRGRGARCATRSACAIPPGLPAAFTDPVDTPLDDLVARYAAHARSVHRPTTSPRGSASPRARCAHALDALEADGRVVRGEFRPGRRRARVVRRRRAAPAAPALARGAAARGRAGRRRRRSRGSCRRGRASVAAGAAPTRSSRRSTRLQGVAIPASVLERDVLPARVAATGRPMLDALSRRASSCGSAPARSAPTTVASRSFFRDRVRPPGAGRAIGDPPDGTRARRDPRAPRCGAAPRSGPTSSPRRAPPTNATVLAALWDLVWAGEVTNDTFGPAARVRSGRRAGVAQRGAKPRPGSPAARSGRPPARAAGRWSRRCSNRDADADRERRTRARCNSARAPRRRHARGRPRRGHAGGFAGVYPVLRALEESGQARRGYFVAGLGAAQFALPGRGRPAPRAPRTAAAEPEVRRARRHRPRPAVRRRAPVAGVRTAAVQRTAGRVRRARRRRARRLPRARRQDPAHVRRRRPSTGPTPSRRSRKTAGSARSSSVRSTGSLRRPTPPPTRCAPPASPTATTARRSAAKTTAGAPRSARQPHALRTRRAAGSPAPA